MLFRSAAAHSDRCRSLVALGAPVHALTDAERRRIRLLAVLYLAAGPGAVVKPLTDALLGPKARAEDPEGAAIVAGAFRRAKRRGMFDAIRWLSLRRSDLTFALDRLETPTLLATNADDAMWTVAAAQTAAAHLRNGALAILPGSGHIGPLLQAAPDLVTLLTAFWRDPQAVIARHRTQQSSPTG